MLQKADYSLQDIQKAEKRADATRNTMNERIYRKDNAQRKFCPRAFHYCSSWGAQTDASRVVGGLKNTHIWVEQTA
jgi:hypothetical protein